ncbi:hypothetical protein [Aridibaculum aurantiacum]|uniref:hypothetical protein n=1 Tax=Aridibaculum aurantiacum TaxID=2810307 RepID=UPI001A95A5B4|nr:hypothetical protein [Aridibaculum aurantiacum]
MKNDVEPLSGQDSLLIIQQMIDTAKREQKDDGMGWIIWGWLLFISSIGTVINLQYQWLSTFFFWNAFGFIVILLAIYETFKNFVLKQKVKVRTYTKDIFKKLNIGFFVCLMFIIISMNIGISPSKGFPLLMNLYGFWILIYGALLNFKPSMVGAFAMWALAFVALFIPRIITGTHDEGVTHFSWVMILHGAGVLFGYIIPGHIANMEFKKVAARNSRKEHTGV